MNRGTEIELRTKPAHPRRLAACGVAINPTVPRFWTTRGSWRAGALHEDCRRVRGGGGNPGRGELEPCARHRAHERKFHFAIVHMSRGLSPSLRTTEASKPECMRQSWHFGSRRDSQ